MNPMHKDAAQSQEYPSHNEIAFLRLLHLADSALPIGSLAHSFGLESLVSFGILSVSDLPDFLKNYLQESGMLEAVACREAFHLAVSSNENFPTHAWLKINDQLSAFKPARESRGGSAALGRSFLQAVLALDDYPTLREAREAARASGTLLHHSAVFGLVSATLSFDEDRTVLAFLHQLTASLISACQRLMPLGQTEATRILWNLKSTITEVSSRSANCTLEDVTRFTPLLDWGAMEHPALPTRLFIS
jgi:urease accessory protein